MRSMLTYSAKKERMAIEQAARAEKREKEVFCVDVVDDVVVDEDVVC